MNPLELKHIFDLECGKTAYILGTGPSLSDFDWSYLNQPDSISICVNGAISSADRFDYFYFVDFNNFVRYPERVSIANAKAGRVVIGTYPNGWRLTHPSFFG